MLLRNRKTGKVALNTCLLFNEEKTKNNHSEEEMDLNEIIKDVESHLPHALPHKEKKIILDQISACIKHDPKKIKQLADEFSKLTTQSQESKSNKNSIGYELSDFMKLLASQFASAKLGPLMLLPAVAAEFVINSGKPANSPLDLCSGVILGCLQGYLSNGTNSEWQADLPQFARQVQLSGTNDDTAIYLQLRDCMTLDKVGQLAIDALKTGTSSAKLTCSSASSMWHDYQLISQVTSTPSDACLTLQNNFAAVSQGCMSEIGRLKQTGVIVGAVLGSIAGCALLAAAAYFCRQRCQRSNNGYYHTPSYHV